MILLMYCIFLQLLCVAERVLNKVLRLVIYDPRTTESRLRTMLDNLFLAGVFSFVLNLLSLPLQVVSTVVSFIARNLLISVWVLMLVALMVNLSESSSAVLSTTVNMYNAGVGPAVDMLVVKPLEFFDTIFTALVPLYNGVAWMLSQIFMKVAIPFLGVHVDRLPRLVGDFGLMCATTGRACSILADRYVQCGIQAQTQNAYLGNLNTTGHDAFKPFTPHNLQCIANTNFMTLDLMTPGIYARKTMLHLHYMLTSSCSVLTAPLDIVLYPFLDFNFYKAVHCLVNTVLHFVIAVPIITTTRCSYARDPLLEFTDTEQALMCAPDFKPGFLIATACIQSLGKLIDNWLNMMLVVVEHNVGRVTVVCSQTATIGEVWDGVEDLFDARDKPLKIVGMSDAMLAVTDGTSTAFHSLTDGASTVWAIGNFPFPIDPRLGVAPVKYGEVFDADAEGDVRTGLFGCRCFDREAVDGVESIEVVCSSVPYRANTHDNDEAYASHTVQRIVFDSASATSTMTCARTVIRVSALRFSRQRFASASASGTDSPFADPLNAFGSASGEVQSHSADAMLYIQPLCDGPRESCLANINNCFPWCMGLHVAGQRNQQLRVYNARTWEDFVALEQMDCMASETGPSSCAPGTGARVVNMDANFSYATDCGVTVSECIPQDSTTTFMSIENLRSLNSNTSTGRAVESGFVAHRDETLPMVRLSSQPFVAAGEVFLHQHEIAGQPGKFELVVGRLYDNKMGSFSMQFEQLSLLSNRQTVRLKLCDTEADSTCYYNALVEHTIILPSSYVVSSATNIAVTSEWAVHWAVNPENAVFRSVLDFCATGTSGFAVNVVSSYSKPRVWTLKTMRASSMNPSRQEFAAADENGLYSYMVVPDWVVFEGFSDGMCDKQSNFKIVDLEYINANNVLVTTLYTTMRHYRIHGEVCEGCPYEYKRYFLNPNRHDCVAPDEGEGAIFTCWRHERMGMFVDNEIPAAVYGELCPALRRMPLLGSYAAEVVLIAVHSVHVVLDAVLTLLVIYAREKQVSDMSDLWELRLQKPTFHSMLDSSGTELLNFEKVVRSFDKAALYGSDVIIRSGKVFAGTAGYSTIEPVLAGTAKVMQHSAGFIMMPGPLAKQYEALQNLFQQQTQRALSVTTASVKGKAWGFVTGVATGIMTQISGIKVCLRLLKKMAIRQFKEFTRRSMLKNVLAAAKFAAHKGSKGAFRLGKTAAKNPQVQKITSLATVVQLRDVSMAILAENYEDIDRSFLDNVRVMCEGSAQIAGYQTSLGQTVRHACHLFPDMLKAMLTLSVVLLADYVVMSCVCKQVQEQKRLEAIDENCMGQMTPSHWKVWMLQQRQALTNDALSVCHSSMDFANDRLVTVFDPVSSRLSKLVESMQGLLNYAVVMTGIDFGNCNDFKTPYMVSLMPEPADYFMPCINTKDCRMRCLDVYNAFDEAKEASVAMPVYVARINTLVESKYFSLDDIEEQRHLPPFEIIGVTELYSAACLVVCTRNMAADSRCLAVVGVDIDKHTVGLAYYCIPSDVTQYVHQYDGLDDAEFQKTTWNANEVVEQAYLASLHKIGNAQLDDVVVLTKNREDTVKTLYLYTADRVGITLLRTVEFALDTYNYVTDVSNDAYVLNVLDEVRLLPSTSVRAEFDLYILGLKTVIDVTTSPSGLHQNTQRIMRVCMHKRYVLSTDDAQRPLLSHTKDCRSDMDLIFSKSHLQMCLNEACDDVLSMPTSVQSQEQTSTFAQRFSVTDQRYWEPKNLTTFFAERSGARSLSQIIGYDASRPLYVTANKQAVVNKKHVSGTARLTRGTRGVDDGTVTADVLVTGTVSAHRSWIQSVRMRLDPAKSEFAAGVHTSTLTNQSVEVHVQCTIDNCIGCQTNPSQLRHVDLQSKCSAAARCGIQKCVGTPIDMRKPLCNIASVLLEPLHAARIVLHSGWRLLSSSIIELVELSKARQKKHQWRFPDEEMTQWTCLAKNTIVGTAAIFTSSLNLFVSMVGMTDDNFAQDQMRSSVLDARWYARYYMSSMALTNLIASPFLAIVYEMMVWQKLISCASSDFVAIIVDGIEGKLSTQLVIVSHNEATIRQKKNSVTGVCLSEKMSERIRELGLEGSTDTSSFMANEFIALGDRLTSIGTNTIISARAMRVDTGIALLIGIVSSFIDWVQTIDWKHCSMPVVHNSLVYKCVCGDHAHMVPSILRQAKTDSSAFWCTGPMFIVDTSGDEKLIWNPYSLAELTAQDLSFETYVKCIAKGSSCEKERIKLPLLERQGVNVMPVITQCRDNYKNKRWDPAVLTLGLFTQEQWALGAAGVGDKNITLLDVSEHQKLFQRRIRAMASVIEPLVISDTLWACLREASVTSNPALEGVCRRQWAGVSDDLWFAYDKTTSPYFAHIDACLTFSGSEKGFNTRNNASKSPMLWAARSANTMPVAERHEIIQSWQSQRLQVAQARIDALYKERIEPTLRLLTRNISENLETNLWSMEGDELHQFVDCVVLGPFGSADLFSSFDLSSGNGKFRVPRYHRGDEHSRHYIEGQTARRENGESASKTGSEARRRIIDAVLAYVHDRTDDITRTAAVNRINLIQSQFMDKRNFYCACPDSGTPSLECCQRPDWKRIADLSFNTKELFANIYNIQSEVLQGAMDAIFDSDVLTKMWTEREFTYMADTPMSEAERVELAHAYVFDFQHPVREYSPAEVPAQITGATLWQRCTSLLSASFFTLPLAAGTQNVDAKTTYDPTMSGGDAYMHGMEEAIQTILHRARQDSPVFWSHSHRYVASDSVWCETSGLPRPPDQADPPGAFQAQRWYEQDFSEENVRGGTLKHAVFAGEQASHCLCGWTLQGQCHVPINCDALEPEENMRETWARLCNAKYTAREDVYDLMHILQHSVFDPAVVSSCRDLVPDVVWGLLSPADQFAWYAQDDSVPAKVNLKHLATHGPAGIRLGLFAQKQRPHSLAAFIQQHNLLRRDPRHPSFNSRLRHSIAQPVCASGLRNFLKEDLSGYFRDVLFPMAHSVSQAPFAAYCSTWAVERTLELAMGQIFGDATPDVLVRQTQTAAMWRRRCDIQLKQLGICLLRGVYDMAPANAHVVPAHCSFTVHAQHNCVGVFYVTEQCIVRCDAQFYDPCLCSTQVCSEIVFTKNTCNAGMIPFNPIATVLDDNILLYSMNWPASLPANEGGSVRVEELNAQLAQIHASVVHVSFEDATILPSLAAYIVSQQPGDETAAPRAHCDDLLDYLDEDAQHPVGYHPTCACLRAETQMRGFDSWMSVPHDTPRAWAVDPVRLRNMTQYSTSFGASHLTCDSAVYGAVDHQLNVLDLVSRWDATAPADAAVPRAARIVQENDMRTLGVASGDQFDTPLMGTSRSKPSLLRHSTGLVRDWVTLHGRDAQLEAALDAHWPHYMQDEFDAYGTDAASVPANCPMPPLMTCQPNTQDCCSGVTGCGLECQTRAEQGVDGLQDSSVGICVAAGTCFQHRHCADDHLCSGLGVCVAAHMYLQNDMDVALEAQLFSDDRVSCPLATTGFSAHESIPDFARTHGMCSFRDWYHYQNLTRALLPGADGLLHVPDQIVHRTDVHAPHTLRDVKTLQMQAHVCDRTYQHTSMGICLDDALHRIRVSRVYGEGEPGAPDKPMTHATAIRTWQDSGANSSIRFCDMGRALSRTNAINGFLSPYEYEDPVTQLREDTLEHVPTTVGRCIDFAVCESQRFTVQGLPVQQRLVRQVAWTSEEVILAADHRPYTHADAEACLGAGYLMLSADSFERCVVDRMTVPMLNFLFTMAPEFLAFDTEYHTDDAATNKWSQAALQEAFARLRVRCPRAMTQRIDDRQDYALFAHMLLVLSMPYTPTDAASVTNYANMLLPSVFGIDTQRARDTTRGFDTIQEYLEQATCARYIDSRLQLVRHSIFTSNQAYTAESVLAQQFVGDTLYFFHARAVVHLPFRWFWQCVVLSRSPQSGESGAPREWFRGLTDEDAALVSEQCDVFAEAVPPGALVTIKQRLQSSPHIYTVTDDIPEMAAAMAHDIDDTVALALAALGLPMFPDVYYMRKTGESDCLHHNVFVLNSCWHKYGRDASQVVDAEEIIRTSDGSPVRSLYHMMRLLIFGQEAYAKNLYDFALEDLEAQQVVSLALSLDVMVLASTDFFPAIRFLHLDAYSKRPTSQQPLAGDVVNPAYATCQRNCEAPGAEFVLKQFEFKVQDGNFVKIDVYRNNNEDRSTVTASEAEYLLVQSFRKLIYFQSSFASNNVHRDTRVSRHFMATHGLAALETTAAREYNSFMRTKTFKCGASIEHNLPTNRLHAALNRCVNNLQEKVGWAVPAGGLLHMRVPASVLRRGFMLSFKEFRGDESKFLQNLTSPAWATKKYIAAFDTMCSMRGGETTTINPYWAINYETTTGCDTYMQDNLRLTDARCLTENAGQTCANRFPAFERALADKMPAYCREHANEVATGRRGTLRRGFTELCDRVPDVPDMCLLRHGSFAGTTGEPVTDLDAHHPASKQQGLWSFSNSIFRGSVFTPDDSAGLQALELLPTDIAGHSLGFLVDKNGLLGLHCVNLLGDALESCRVSNQHWMHNLKDNWAWQHARQDTLWPSGAGSEPVSWTCPLRLVRAMSGTADRRTLRSPSRDRNDFRFQHITAPSNFAHPIVAGTRDLLLMPGRYISPVSACTSDASDSVAACHSSALLHKSIAHSRELIWQTVAYPKDHTGPGVSCQQILDWPHQPFISWDEDTGPGTEYERLHCNVLDRLPQFQVQLKVRTASRSRQQRSSVDPGGVCHMGRLKRLPVTARPTEKLQHCGTSEDDELQCRYYDPIARRSYTRTEPERTPAAPAVTRPLRKNTPCAKCEPHRDGAFVDVDGTLRDTPGNRRLLSTGEHVHVSTARLVSSYLRRLVCPQAAEAPCAELQRIFNTAHWTSGGFLQGLFAAKDSTDFYKSFRPDRPETRARAVAVDDAQLWERNWVWCDPRTSVCAGSVSKRDWINPSTRVQACRAAISQHAMHASSTVHFCLIDAGTQRLCQLVLEWNAEITNILCRAAGMSSCPDAGFFYNPTGYSADNRMFEHDSVQAFYASTGKGNCEKTNMTAVTETQIASNKQLLNKCASVKLLPILQLLYLARGAVHQVTELMYYTAQITLNACQLIFMAFMPSPLGLKAVANKILLYMRLFFDTLASIVDLIYGAMFQFIFGFGQNKMLVEVLRLLCRFAQFVDNFVIKRGLCVVLKIFSDFFKSLYDLIVQLSNVSILGVKPLTWLHHAIGNIFLFAQNVFDILINLMCHSAPLECEFELPEDPDENGPGTLPVVSRCWSSYTTFFGDSQSLACTAADTCKRSLTDSRLIMCGACPAEDPPNPLNFQFGCDTIIKSCTCDVPRLAPSFCYSNEECEAPAQACAFIDSDFELLDAYTVCEACTSRPVCMVARGTSVGQCACGLKELEYARCRAEDVGSLVALPYSKMCVLQTDARVSASVSYSTEFSAASVAHCMAVDASTSYCMRMVDLADNFYIVSTHTTQSRRLLLDTGSSDALRLNASVTRHPPCQDALDSDADTHVRRQCVTRYVQSAATVDDIGLHSDVSRCAFCSSEDFWNMLMLDPMIIAFLAVHPHKLWHVLMRHTAFSHVLHIAMRLHAQAQDLIAVVMHTNVSDFIGLNTSASGIVLVSKNTRIVSHHMVQTLHSLAQWEAGKASSPLLGVHIEWGFRQQSKADQDLVPSPPPANQSTPQASPATNAAGRRLLSLDDIARDMDFEVRRAFATQRTYSNQISSAFDYNFPLASSTETRQWLESWPPTLGSSAQSVDGTCAPAGDFARIVLYGFGNTSLAYSSNPVMPKTTLRQSFPALHDSMATPAEFRPNNPGASGDAQGARNDPLLNGMMWVLNEISKGLGLRRTMFYDVLYSIVDELQSNLMCDLAAVQTCSKWNVSIGNGLIVVSSYFFVIYVLLSAFKLEFLAVFAIPFLWVFLWRLCYGYSWTCVPLLPPCLIQDIYKTTLAVFPKQIAIPQPLWQNFACADISPINASCLRTCQDEPFGFVDLQTVVAWVLAETGSNSSTVISVVRRLPIFNETVFAEQILQAEKVISDDVAGFVTANRLCAAINSYRLVPYVFVVALAAALFILIVRITLAVIFGSFTGAFAVFLPSFTR